MIKSHPALESVLAGFWGPPQQMRAPASCAESVPVRAAQSARDGR